MDEFENKNNMKLSLNFKNAWFGVSTDQDNKSLQNLIPN